MNKIGKNVEKDANGKLRRWLCSFNGSDPLAIVIGATVNGLSFVRSLGRRGIPCLLLDSHTMAASYSRFAHYYNLPPAEHDPQGWIEFLKLVRSHVDFSPLIFPTSDVHCLFLSQYAQVLKTSFRFILPDKDTLEKIINKRSQYDFAKSLGITIPETYYPDSEASVCEIANTIEYPCILKPFTHFGRRKLKNKKVLVIQSPIELISIFELLSNHEDTLMIEGENNYMIQEVVPGGDDAIYGYHAFWGRCNNEIAWITSRKLRQSPPQFGDGTLRVTINVPEVAELSRRILKELKYCGFVGVEFKLDERDKTYKLMEINTRTGLMNQLPITAGVDFPWIAYRYLVDKNNNKIVSSLFTPGIKWLNELPDFKSYLIQRKTGNLSFYGWIKSLKGTNSFALWDRKDPKPMIITFLWNIAAVFRKIF